VPACLLAGNGTKLAAFKCGLQFLTKPCKNFGSGSFTAMWDGVIADVLLYDDGVPVRHYVTRKTGKVLKKKAVDMNAVRESWEKIIFGEYLRYQSASSYHRLHR